MSEIHSINKNASQSSPPEDGPDNNTKSKQSVDSDLESEKTLTSSKSEAVAAMKGDADYTQHISYLADGSAIYTDASTKAQYKWNTEKSAWELYSANEANSSLGQDPYENEHYRWCTKTQKWIPKVEVKDHVWDSNKNEWIPIDPTAKNNTESNSSESEQRTFVDQDGVTFFWDTEKNAWFPKIGEDFLAQYQMNYGCSEYPKSEDVKVSATPTSEEIKTQTELKTDIQKPNAGKSNLQEPPKWFDLDETKNTKVYVWNLPPDITLDEFGELMGKCGMVMRDPQTHKYKLKLYVDEYGFNKGDGLCDYIKVESVDLALKILDEYNYRGRKIRVQRAKFQMKGDYNPALKPKRKKKDKQKLQKMKEKLFDWRPEKMRGERSKFEKVVIVKNLFDPKALAEDVQLILEYQNDLRTECEKFGAVRKVIVYDQHPEGIAQVNMSSVEEADLVIQALNGRLFDKRKLEAEHWDGKTKYKSEEAETELEKRLTKWDKFLENDNDCDNEMADKSAKE